MFESLLIRRQRRFDVKNPIDLGMLAEALLFYGSVKVVADQAMLKQMLNEIGPDLLIEFLDRGALSIDYLGVNIGIQTKNTNTAFEEHDPIFYSVPRFSLKTYSRQVLTDSLGNTSNSRLLANKFSKRVGILSHDHSLRDDIIDDFNDSDYVESSIDHLIKIYAPDYRHKGRIVFRLKKKGKFLTANTNIDFSALNQAYHKRVSPTHSSMSSAYLLSHLFEVRRDIYLATRYESEIATDAINSRLLSLKYEDLTKRRIRSEHSLELFQDFVLDDARAIREAINSGSQSFSDLLRVVDKASRFKEWLTGKPEDAQLVKDYFREISTETWIDKLPIRSARWVLFTGVGMLIDLAGAQGIGTAAATATNIALSGADNFILNKILRGWKPNQFVDGPLAVFSKRQK